MVSSFLHYSESFISHVPAEEGYFIAPIRINGSGIESFFSKLKFGAWGQLSAINYGSGVARIQAKTEADRVTASAKSYRDESVIVQTTPVLPRSDVAVHAEGRSKPYGFSVTEFLFPFNISQSTLGGRNGSNACTLTAIFVGNYFLRNMLPNISSIVLPVEWSSVVVNCINDGNTLYDAVFEGQSSIRGLWVPIVMQMRLLSLEPSDWLWIIRDHRKSEVVRDHQKRFGSCQSIKKRHLSCYYTIVKRELICVNEEVKSDMGEKKWPCTVFRRKPECMRSNKKVRKTRFAEASITFL